MIKKLITKILNKVCGYVEYDKNISTIITDNIGKINVSTVTREGQCKNSRDRFDAGLSTAFMTVETEHTKFSDKYVALFTTRYYKRKLI